MEWLKSKWVWLVGLVAGGLVVLVAFFLGRYRKSGELNLAVAEHELKKSGEAANAASAKVIELSSKQREIAKEILIEKAKRAGLDDEWEKMSADDVRKRLIDLGLIR